ncbi:MAG: DUF1351 domain-containing protein, partial [Bacteroidales bacterium]|nr:DUF1351 domain-containing protein [Bacteroidales bacterium]
MTEQTNQLISVIQLPIIEERLQSISADIQEQTSRVLALEVTEDTVKEIKKHRTELTKSFNALEEQRKSVKAAVMAPYEAFEKVYKQYVTDIFKPADAKLKARIDEVENALLDKKKADVEAYFQEKAAAHNIDFVKFDQLGIKVTFSDSMKKLKEQVDDALNKISGELAVIATMEFPEEILVEYKENLDLTSSVLTVKKRRERLEVELQRKAETIPLVHIVESTSIPEPVKPVVNEPEAKQEAVTAASA